MSLCNHCWCGVGFSLGSIVPMIFSVLACSILMLLPMVILPLGQCLSLSWVHHTSCCVPIFSLVWCPYLLILPAVRPLDPLLLLLWIIVKIFFSPPHKYNLERLFCGLRSYSFRHISTWLQMCNPKFIQAVWLMNCIPAGVYMLSLKKLSKWHALFLTSESSFLGRLNNL